MISRWEDLPIGTYLRLCDAVQVKDELSRRIAMVSVLSGLSEEEIDELSLTEYLTYQDSLKFLDDRFKEPKPRREYILGGTEYTAVERFDKITTGQFISYEEYLKMEDNIIPMLSVCLVPKGHKFGDGYDMDKVREDISRYLSTPDAYALRNFLWLSLRRYVEATLTYSIWTTRVNLRMPRKERKAQVRTLREARRSLASGDGWPR